VVRGTEGGGRGGREAGRGGERLFPSKAIETTWDKYREGRERKGKKEEQGPCLRLPTSSTVGLEIATQNHVFPRLAYRPPSLHPSLPPSDLSQGVYTEEDSIRAWEVMLGRYVNSYNVFAADLRSVPPSLLPSLPLSLLPFFPSFLPSFTSCSCPPLDLLLSLSRVCCRGHKPPLPS